MFCISIQVFCISFQLFSSQAFKEEESNMQSLVGYVWPLPVYRAHFKKEPKELGHRVQNLHGRRAVLLGPAHGTHLTVPGVEAFFRNKRAGV